MSRTRAFLPGPLSTGTGIEPPPDTVHYLKNVLRVKAGARLQVFDGKGLEFRAVVTGISKKSLQLDIVEPVQTTPESPLQVHLGIAVSKGERMDTVVQKATELGVAEISPLLSERVAVKLEPARWQRKQDHWQQVATSACEQSGRAVIPPVHAPRPFVDWLKSVEADRRFILQPGGAVLSGGDDAPLRVCLLIGPEGGWSDAELSLAGSAGFEALSLGPRVLRTETAPLAALAVLQYLWGDGR